MAFYCIVETGENYLIFLHLMTRGIHHSWDNSSQDAHDINFPKLILGASTPFHEEIPAFP